MDRRGFFKILMSLVTGAYLAFVPKTKGLTMESLLRCKKELEDAERRSGIEFMCEVQRNGMVVFCDNHALYRLHSSKEFVLGDRIVLPDGTVFIYMKWAVNGS